MVVTRRALALAWMFAVLAPAAASAGPPAIVVDPGQVQRPISPLLYGFDWESGSESLISDPAKGAFNPLTNSINANLHANVSEVAPTVIRFPGGTHSNYYDWRRAIGPQAMRGCQYRRWFESPSSSVFGPDESGRWMEQLGGEMNVVVNSNSLSPAVAADWVEYMNAPNGTNPNGGTAWAQVRASNGHPAPYGVRYWEVGNEMSNNPTWLSGVATEAERASLYFSGGSTSFTGQQVGTQCRRDAADSRSDGTANQERYAWYPPVVPTSVVLRVAGVTWTRVSSLATAGASDRVYTVDATTGRIAFGDGVHGAIPANGAEIRIDYESGPHAGFSEFYTAIKEVDPNAKVCWGTDRIDYPVAGTAPFDCVQRHAYSGGPPRRYTDATEAHDWAMRSADQVGASMAGQQRALANARPGAGLAITEYGVFPGWGGPTSTYLRSLDVGLYTANMLLDFARAGVPLAQQQQLSTYEPGNEPAGIRPAIEARNMSSFRYYPDFTPQAAAHVINVFSHMLGDTLVTSRVVGNPTRTPDAPDLNPYPALKVDATRDASGRVTLLVINRDPSRAITASVLPRRFAYSGTAEVWTVNGTSTTASNEPGGSTGSVTLTKGTASVAAGGFDRTFPAHSVTAIRLAPPATPPAAPESGAGLGAPSTTVAPGGSTSTRLTLANAGSVTASGTVSVVAPDGWTASVTPTSYTLAPGAGTSGTLSVTVPASASGGRHDVAVVVRQGGQVADVDVFTVNVPADPAGVWREIVVDDFESGTVGSPPSAWSVSGPSGSVTVQNDATAGGKALAIRRATTGSTLISASRTFGTLAGDVLLSANVRADQATAGLGIHLADGSGGSIAACAPGASGQWQCMNGSTTSFTSVGAYTPGTWQRIDMVLHATTYDVYLDGVRVATPGRASTAAPSQLIARIAATNTGVSSYALDDVAVKTTSFPSVYSEDFESDAIGSPPASLNVSGPAGGITVQSHPAGGKMLVVRRATAGSTEIAARRTFGALSGDVKLSAELRPDHVTAGLGLRLLDSAGNPITACTPATSGRWACTDGTEASFTYFSAYSPATWYRLDVVLRAATGRVEIYLNGRKYGDVARVSDNPPTALVVRIPTTNTGVSSYALDDISIGGI